MKFYKIWRTYSRVYSGHNCSCISNVALVIPLPDTFYFNDVLQQWRSQRGEFKGGGFNPPICIEAVFFHSRKVTAIKYYNVSLTTRRTINSHNLRKTNNLGRVVRLLAW